MTNLFRRKFVKMGLLGAAGAAGPCTMLAATSDVPEKISFSDLYFNVRKFGAVGDGLQIDSIAINKAIAAASGVGGGTVYFPAGTYTSYSIRLQSNIRVLLDLGATIVSAQVPVDGVISGGYDAAEPNGPWETYQDYGHNHWHNSLIWGEGLHDVVIEGYGLIWGKHLSRGGKGTGRHNEGLPKAESPGVANKAIALKNCHNVLLRDFSLLEGGHVGVLATAVDNLTVDNLKIDTNRDAMNIDCCRNVRVSNCSVNSPWDDGICLKSSFSLGYARTTENVTITNCYLTGMYEVGSLLDGSLRKLVLTASQVPTGRIKLGTSSAGGFLNIAISNCVFDTCRGLSIENVDGGRLEDVAITGVTMRNITTTPLFLRLGSRLAVPQGATVGTLKRIRFSNIVSYQAAATYAPFVSGIPNHPIEDVQFSDVYLHHTGGGSPEQTKRMPPELETAYPEPSRFGPLPAHGFFVRHVHNIDFDHVEIAYDARDARYAFWLEDVDGASFYRIKIPSQTAAPVFSLIETKNSTIAASRGFRDAPLQADGHMVFP
ncbi:glycoside hydrolase family 28 protein [Telmatobacter bradus]|uniref:rhamnogalacturonidase n=1 Tax=Telmatobacter bradus TaxID=474953 RepID=UPI003B435C87